jgi:hypothetical protein
MTTGLGFFDLLTQGLDALNKHSDQLDLASKREPSIESKTASDAQSTAAASNLDLSQGVLLRRGKIVDSFAYMHSYKVQVSGGGPPAMCTMLGQAGNSIIGTRQLTTLPPGAIVWVIIDPGLTDTGFIVGAEPQFMTDAKYGLSDVIAQAGRSGFKVDEAHLYPLAHPNAGGLTDFSAGRPFDSTTLGEWGSISDTGIRMFIDSFMFQVAVNEVCGIYGFLHDSLLRVAGHNLEIRTAGSELEAFDDDGEFNHIQGYTPYYWEQLGALQFGVNTFVDLAPEAYQLATPEYSAVEPTYDDQMPFHRVTHLQGYLGQGGKRQVILPPTGQDRLRYSSENNLAGVFSEDISLTGRYMLRSAKGISLVKRPYIPAAKRKKRPEHKDGDNSLNYKAAGQQGSGDDHEVSDSVKATGANASLLRAAGVMDLHSYVFNWEANHAFKYHKEDWDIQDEDQSPLSGTTSWSSFSVLASQQYLDPAPEVQHRVDHRYGSATYFQNESFLTLLDDGGIVLADGFGGEIRMSGGSLFISAPGDVWLKSGRNVNCWSGKDFIARAKNSIDITATDKDVRIKAEKNMQVLAGNSGTGGLLLESRGSNSYDFSKSGEDVVSGGVMVRSAIAPFVTWAPDIYMRSGIVDGYTVGGNIVLDTNGDPDNLGAGSIKLHSNNVDMFVKNSVKHCFKQGNADVTQVNEFSHMHTSLSTSVGVSGTLAVDGDILMDGWLSVAGGHIATSLANSRGGHVSDLTQPVPTGAVGPAAGVLLPGDQLARDSIAEYTTRRQVPLGEECDKSFEIIDILYYMENRPGHENLLSRATMSLRSKDQYGTDSFVLFEDRWQQLARLFGSTNKWTEKSVRVGPTGEETYPYPGKEAKLQPVEHELTKISSTGYVAIPLDSDKYQDPEHKLGESQKLNGNYIII